MKINNLFEEWFWYSVVFLFVSRKFNVTEMEPEGFQTKITVYSDVDNCLEHSNS